jgi:DNA polymerase III alpha subunit (gram-positive type)
MAVKLLVNQLQNQASVCFDTETTGINTLHAELVGLSFSFLENKEVIISWNVFFVKLSEEAEAFDLLNGFIKLIYCPGCFQHQDFLRLQT